MFVHTLNQLKLEQPISRVGRQTGRRGLLQIQYDFTRKLSFASFGFTWFIALCAVITGLVLPPCISLTSHTEQNKSPTNTNDVFITACYMCLMLGSSLHQISIVQIRIKLQQKFYIQRSKAARFRISGFWYISEQGMLPFYTTYEGMYGAWKF